MGSTKTENEWNTLHVSGSVINSAQSSVKKNNWKCDSQDYYLKESLSSILCFIIKGKGSSWKRFDPEILVCCNIAHI